jgi:hypothetical protein
MVVDKAVLGDTAMELISSVTPVSIVLSGDLPG